MNLLDEGRDQTPPAFDAQIRTDTPIAHCPSLAKRTAPEGVGGESRSSVCIKQHGCRLRFHTEAAFPAYRGLSGPRCTRLLQIASEAGGLFFTPGAVRRALRFGRAGPPAAGEETGTRAVEVGPGLAHIKGTGVCTAATCKPPCKQACGLTPKLAKRTFSGMKPGG